LRQVAHTSTGPTNIFSDLMRRGQPFRRRENVGNDGMFIAHASL